jgi:hypothetical protein
MVDSPSSVAISHDEFPLCLSHALWVAWYGLKRQHVGYF